MSTQFSKQEKEKTSIPKLDLSKFLTEDALSSVAGKPGIFSVHTDGDKCDTSKGCNCWWLKLDTCLLLKNWWKTKSVCLHRIILVETALSGNWFASANFRVNEFSNKIWLIFVQEHQFLPYISLKPNVYGCISSPIVTNIREFRFCRKT